MANLAYFEVPVDDFSRAQRFYKTILGWKFSRDTNDTPTMEYWDITAGEPKEGMLHSGGMYKRQIPGTPIVTYAVVEDVDRAIAQVGQLGGKIVVPKMVIDTIGDVATVQDSEGNMIGIWKPLQK